MNAFSTTSPDSDPELQRLLEESSARPASNGREFIVEYGLAVAMVAASVAMIVALPAGAEWNAPLVLALIGSYALADRVQFHVGAGWAVPTQLVLVPMLFLAPTPAVPLLVAVACLLGRLPAYANRSLSLSRAAIDVGDAWYAVGPAFVLALAGSADPAWTDWPLYLAALAAQFACDLGQSLIRGRYVLRVRTLQHLDEIRSAYLVDILLSPVGLLVAFAAVDQEWAFLAVLPLIGLIAIFAREREARIENALVLGRAYRGTAHLMAELLSTSDEYTGNHSRSVVVLAHQVGERLGLNEMALREIEFGALLHDIGKWAIPNDIINKPGILTEEEMALMRTHTVEGEQMLDRIGGVLADVGQVVRSHHEFYDGSGYPDGLAGEDIPIASRVISACDAFNAMTTDRSYRSAMSIAEAIEELRVYAGSQFDPRVVDALVRIVSTWEGTAAPEEALPVEVLETAA